MPEGRLSFAAPGLKSLPAPPIPGSDDRQCAAHALPLEIAPGAPHVGVDLPFQLVDGGETALVAEAAQEPHAHHVAVEVAAPIHYVCLDRRFGLALESGPDADVRHAPPPRALDERGRDVDAPARDDAVL